MCVLLAAAIVCCAIGCESTRAQKNRQRNTATYRAEVQLSTPTYTLFGVQHIEYDLPEQTDVIWLWTGQATIKQALLDGKEIAFAQEGAYCQLVPKTPPAYGESVQLQIEFEAAMTAGVVQDYLPFVCAYDNGYCRPQPVEFAPYARVEQGDCTVQIDLPVTLAACHSGTRENISFPERQRLLYRLTAGHSLFAVSPDWVCRSKTVQDTSLALYIQNTRCALQSQAAEFVDKAVAVLGPCPVAVSVAQSHAFAVSEGLVLADDQADVQLGLAMQWLLPYTTQTDAWVLPSLAAFYRWLCNADSAANDLYNATLADCCLYQTLQYGADTRLDAPLGDYDKDAYVALLQQKGMLMWYSLYQVVGDKLPAALRYALQTCPTQDEFVRRLFAKIGDYGYFLDAWLGGDVVLY